MAKLNIVNARWADETQVSRLALHTGTRIVDNCHQEAVPCGMTREI